MLTLSLVLTCTSIKTSFCPALSKVLLFVFEFLLFLSVKTLQMRNLVINLF